MGFDVHSVKELQRPLLHVNRDRRNGKFHSLGYPTRMTIILQADRVTHLDDPTSQSPEATKQSSTSSLLLFLPKEPHHI